VFACVRYFQGAVSALRGANNLERLQCNHCSNISGEVSTLAALPVIKGIGLAHTRVSGEAGPLFLFFVRTLFGASLFACSLAS